MSLHDLCWTAADICQIKSMAWYLLCLPWMIATRPDRTHAPPKTFPVNSPSRRSVSLCPISPALWFPVCFLHRLWNMPPPQLQYFTLRHVLQHNYSWDRYTGTAGTVWRTPVLHKVTGGWSSFCRLRWIFANMSSVKLKPGITVSWKWKMKVCYERRLLWNTAWPGNCTTLYLAENEWPLLLQHTNTSACRKVPCV